ncbi:MAG: hypothetical protein JWO86_8212 [Myxococcaceae bacterium]|nr:hypothetical protein [Myxococcaceae bacterium]
MRTLPWLSLPLLTALAACGTSNGSATSSDGGTGGDPAPASCTTAIDCNPQECVCSDGDTTEGGTVCVQGSCGVSHDTSFCDSVCAKHGGVSTVRPHRNVATSAECDAWCTKGASLTCGATTCDRFFFCGVPKTSCEAATRAALQCAVDKGTWACSKQSTSWSVSASCPTFAELCTTSDAGSH